MPSANLSVDADTVNGLRGSSISESPIFHSARVCWIRGLNYSIGGDCCGDGESL